MKQLKTGSFFGDTNQTLHTGCITLTDTEYTHPKVDWHYHENAYFTFILEGNVMEGDRKGIHHCPAGTLLFHNCQEPHYNVKPDGFTRGFHAEINADWFPNFDLTQPHLQGSFNITQPDIKFLFYQLFKETKADDDVSQAAIESLLLQAFSAMQGPGAKSSNQIPVWVKQVKEILHDDVARQFSLNELAMQINIHPVHLSRHFSRYFGCNLGEYVRKLRIERAFTLMPQKDASLTSIAFKCGFADQSHFLRNFKQFAASNPSVYRKLLLRGC